MELLYEKYYRQLFLYAVTFLESDEEAKDVVSEAFTTVWQNGERMTVCNNPPLLIYTCLSVTDAWTCSVTIRRDVTTQH